MIKKGNKEGKILFFQILNEKLTLFNISCELVRTSYDIISNIGMIKRLYNFLIISPQKGIKHD